MLKQELLKEDCRKKPCSLKSEKVIQTSSGKVHIQNPPEFTFNRPQIIDILP